MTPVFGLKKEDGFTFLVEPLETQCITPGFEGLKPAVEPVIPPRLRNSCPHGFAGLRPASVPGPIPDHPFVNAIRPGAPASTEIRIEALDQAVFQLYGAPTGTWPHVPLWCRGPIGRHADSLTMTNLVPIFFEHQHKDAPDIERFRRLPRTRPLIFIGPPLFGIPTVPTDFDPEPYGGWRALGLAALLAGVP